MNEKECKQKPLIDIIARLWKKDCRVAYKTNETLVEGNGQD